MQAIVTKYFGPTNHRSSRILARCDAGKLSVPWNYALGTDANHDAAALALAAHLSWTGAEYGNLVRGGMPDGKGNCYVFVRGDK